jgi:DNA-binding LacI/PurR family transcriptional regulator
MLYSNRTSPIYPNCSILFDNIPIMSGVRVRRRPTIRDVAAAAHVSISTVSLYLQEVGKVSTETGQRIAAAMTQLGYTPRPRNGARQAPAMFGLLMEELSSTAFPQAFYGRAIHALEMRARQLGFTMLFSSIHEESIPPMVSSGQVAGVIVLGGSPSNDALADKLAKRKTPLVLLDNKVPGLAVDSIVPDNYGGGYAAMQHLLALGHKRIAIIEGPRKYNTLTDRLWGALRAVEAHGRPVGEIVRQPSISSGYPIKGYREMKELLALPTPPSAVFAVSDRAAIGAMEAIKEAGLAIPDDISLIGFDDEIHSAHTTPPLTSVRYDGALMGALAMERLSSLLHDRRHRPLHISVLTELVLRSTTAAQQ